MSGQRRHRARVYTYADAGADGAMESQYVQQPAPDGNGDWWCAKAEPSGRERTLVATAQHDIDAVFEFHDYVPVSDNGLIVADNEAFLIRSIQPRTNGRAEVQVFAERTVDVLNLVGIPVMLLEGPLPIVFYGVYGEADPDEITRAITNIGGGTLVLPTLSGFDTTEWLITATVTGSASPFTLTVGVAMGTLPPGVYTVDGTISSLGAVTAPCRIQLVIQAAPVIGLEPDTLHFSGVAGGSAPADQTITVADPGGVTLQNLAVGNVSDAWLAVDLTGDTITVSCDPAAESPGNLTGTFDVTADNAVTVTVTVTFAVSDAAVPTIALEPSSLSFTGAAGGAVTADQTIAVSDAASIGLVNVGVSNASDPWLIVSILGSTISVHCDPGSLSADNYTGTFDVTADNATTVTVPVSFEVDAAPIPIITLTPSSLAFAGVAGGAATADKTIAVTGSGGALVNVGVSGASAAWLVPSIVGATISVHCDPSAQTAGIKSGSFNVTADNAATVSVPVSFNVTAAPTVALQLSQSSASASGVIGGANPSTQHITISGVGALALAGPVRGTVTYPTGDSGWLTATITGSGPTYDLALAFSTSGKTAPTSTATFQITDANASNSPVSFTVTLTLTAAPIPPPVGNYAPPLYDIPDWLTFDSSTGRFSGDPITHAGFLNPDCDPTSPTFSYGPTGLFNPGVAQVRQFSTLAQLAALAPVCVRGDILELTADITTATVFDLPKHLQDSLSNGWVLLRGNVAPACDEDELHPSAADFAGCRTITYTGLPAYFWRFAAAAHKWHFRHLVFKNGSNQEQYGSFKWGTEPDATSTANAPVGLKMKHCWIDGAWNNTNRFCGRSMLLQGSVADFYGVRAEGCAYNGHSDSQGVLILNSLGEIRWRGGKMEGASENFNFGGGQQKLGNQQYAQDVWFDQVDLSKRPEWMSAAAGGSTAYSQVKCHGEWKCGLRVLVSNCYHANNNGLGNHDWRVKVSPYSAAEANYLQTRDITIWNCYGTNGCGGAFEVSSGDSHPPLPSHALQVLRIQVHNSAFVNPRTNTNNVKRHHIGGLSDALHQLGNVVFTHCGFSLNEQCILFTPSPALCVPGFRYNDCLNYTAVAYQHVASAGGGNNIAALNKYCGTGTSPGTWEMKHNAGVHAAGAADFYGGLESAPYNNLCFTAAGTPGSGAVGSGPLGAELNADLTVKSGSVLYHSASDTTVTVPRDRGPDWSQLQLAMAAHD